MTIPRHLKKEAASFDKHIRERVQHGHVPDLRSHRPCTWFYNNPWRRPEFANMVFGDYLRFLLKQFRKKRTQTILEIGCGPGHMTLELARNGFDVTGIEISPACIEIAGSTADRRSGMRSSGKLHYVNQDIFEWKPGRKFDGIYFNQTLHHFEETGKLMRKVKSLLEPDGTLAVIEPVRDWIDEKDGAVIALIRILLGHTGRWFQPAPAGMDAGQLEKQALEVLHEYSSATDRHEAAQSPHDNSVQATHMIHMLRRHFQQTDYQEGFAFLHRVIGGLRGGKKRELELAAFLKTFDLYCVERKILHPGVFYFAGKLK